MINKEQHPKLHEAVEREIRYGRDRLHRAIETREKAELLPEEIKAMHITSVEYSEYSGLKVNLRNEEGTIKNLKTLGVQGLKPQLSSWSKNNFYAEGNATLPDGTNLYVYVSYLDEPANCTVREVRKRPLQKTYELVCEQTGKVVK